MIVTASMLKARSKDYANPLDKIKRDAAGGGSTQLKLAMLPAPHEVRVYDEPSLFAGKIQAILCRECKHRAKRRDYYDYLFYIDKGSKFNLRYLENKPNSPSPIP